MMPTCCSAITDDKHKPNCPSVVIPKLNAEIKSLNEMVEVMEKAMNESKLEAFYAIEGEQTCKRAVYWIDDKLGKALTKINEMRKKL